MQLKNDLQSQILLNEVIQNYFKKNGNRNDRNFLFSTDEDGTYYTCHLIDRKHVIRYSIGTDRGSWLGALEIAIGPHYFGADAFWSHENFERFSIEATTEAVEKNLTLLDEFWNLK